MRSIPAFRSTSPLADHRPKPFSGSGRSPPTGTNLLLCVGMTQKHSSVPWWEYFLGVMLLTAYREFEKRTGVLTTARGAKTAMVLDAIERLPDGFKMVDVERVCPSVTRDMIRVVLNGLKETGTLRCEGRGPTASWRKLKSPSRNG